MYHAFGTAAYLTLSRAFEYLFNALCFSLRLSLAVLKAVLTGFCNFASVIEAELGSAFINYNSILAVRTNDKRLLRHRGKGSGAGRVLELTILYVVPGFFQEVNNRLDVIRALRALGPIPKALVLLLQQFHHDMRR